MTHISPNYPKDLPEIRMLDPNISASCFTGFLEAMQRSNPKGSTTSNPVRDTAANFLDSNNPSYKGPDFTWVEPYGVQLKHFIRKTAGVLSVGVILLPAISFLLSYVPATIEQATTQKKNIQKYPVKNHLAPITIFSANAVNPSLHTARSKTQPSSIKKYTPTHRINGTSVRIRKCGDLSLKKCPVAAQSLPKYTPVQVLSATNAWGKIKFKTPEGYETGYMHINYLKPFTLVIR